MTRSIAGTYGAEAESGIKILRCTKIPGRRVVLDDACEIFHKEVLRWIFASGLVPVAVSRKVFTLAPVIVVSTLVFTGCEKHVSVENLEVVNRQQAQAQKRAGRADHLTDGLTMKEVEAVLGAPAKVSHGKVQREVVKNFNFTTWIYEQDGKTIELSFVDGVLQGQVPMFGEKLDPQAPLKMTKKPETK